MAEDARRRQERQRKDETIASSDPRLRTSKEFFPHLVFLSCVGCGTSSFGTMASLKTYPQLQVALLWQTPLAKAPGAPVCLYLEGGQCCVEFTRSGRYCAMKQTEVAITIER